MTRRAIVGKSATSRGDYWRERIAAQERSGLTVAQFCRENELTEQSFYLWRKRLREPEPMRFALVATARQRRATESDLELVLASGERLRIGADVDVTVLRRVVAALRS